MSKSKWVSWEYKKEFTCNLFGFLFFVVPIFIIVIGTPWLLAAIVVNQIIKLFTGG